MCSALACDFFACEPVRMALSPGEEARVWQSVSLHVCQAQHSRDIIESAGARCIECVSERNGERSLHVLLLLSEGASGWQTLNGSLVPIFTVLTGA